MFGANYAYLAK